MSFKSVDFYATGQLLIINFAFVKYFIKNGNRMKQCISFIGFMTAYDSVRREVLYNILSLVSP